MPIQKIDLTSAPGYLIQVCASCGYKQRIFLDRGASTTKDGPFQLVVDSTLQVAIDDGSPQTVTFDISAFTNFNAVDPAQLVSKLSASLTGATARLDESPECVVIESATNGPSSKVVIVGGTASGALGFEALPADLAPSRPILGVLMGTTKVPDAIALRRCNGCSPGQMSHEIVKRTWDVAPPMAGNPMYEHRRAVNALARYLKAEGMIHPAMAADFAAEQGDPVDFTTGLPGIVFDIPLPQPVNMG
jgi:hypothetical protein